MIYRMAKTERVQVPVPVSEVEEWRRQAAAISVPLSTWITGRVRESDNTEVLHQVITKLMEISEKLDKLERETVKTRRSITSCLEDASAWARITSNSMLKILRHFKLMSDTDENE
jgi:hypothetical protein